MNDRSARKNDQYQSDPIVVEMVKALDHLTGQIVDIPPRPGEAALEPRSRGPRRWMLPTVAAVLLVVAGGGVLIAMISNDEGDQTGAGTSSGSASRSGADGPVIFTAWDPGPYSGVLKPEARGILELRGGCTWIRSEVNEAVSLVVWPARTQWDEQRSSVVLANGKTVAEGDRMIADGPRVGLDRVRADAPDVADLLDRCLPERPRDAEVFAYIHQVSDLNRPPASGPLTTVPGSSPVRTPPVTAVRRSDPTPPSSPPPTTSRS